MSRSTDTARDRSEPAIQDRVVAISGATSGFGLEIARSFAGKGARLVLIGRREERLKTLAAGFGEDRVHVLACDVRDAGAYADRLRALPGPFAAVEILVNNAGLGLGRDLAQESDFADWLAMIETNVSGLIAGTHALLPGMVERNRGHIVNIGSVASQFPTPRNAIYGATKAFVRQFGLSLRADLLGTGVRVTDIEPGQSEGTEFAAVRAKTDPSNEPILYGGNQLLTARDVAEAVEWAVGRPPHVNVNLVQLMSVDQSFGPMAYARA